MVPVLLIAAIGVKTLPSLIYRRRFTWRETIAGGALLSARLSLIIAASAIGLQMGVISESVNAAIILVAIFTVTGAPLVFNRFAPEPAGRAARPIIVAGLEDLGLRVAEQLRAHHEAVVVIDADESKVDRARRRGFTALTARLEQPDLPAATILEQARTLVCTHTEVELNYRICETARTVYGIDRIVAQVNEPTELSRFQRLGVNTLNAAMDRAGMMALLARNPGAYNLLTRVDDDKEVAEVMVRAPLCYDKRLKELQLPGDVLVVALRRNGELVIPHGDTQLECNDHLTLVGSIEAIDTAKQLFRQGES